MVGLVVLAAAAASLICRACPVVRRGVYSDAQACDTLASRDAAASAWLFSSAT